MSSRPASQTLLDHEPWWRRIARTPDAALLDAGAAGELAIARLRLVLTTALLLIPLQTFVAGAREDSMVGLLSAVLALAAASTIWSLTRRGRYQPWMGTTSSLLDVTLVSLGLVVFLLTGDVPGAVNSRVQFEVYFLAIAATGLRYDPRICLAAGAMAVVQYLGVVGWAEWKHDLGDSEMLYAGEGTFSWGTQLSRVLLLAVATALAAEAVRRAQSLRRTATRDRLTGLYNRGYVDGRAAEELARTSRYGRPFTVAMLDVDFFKRVNDTHGHAAGDHVLRTIGARLQSSIRGTDIVGRWGGEEFVVLLPETSIRDAAARLDQFRAQLAEEPLHYHGRPLGPVTISAGIAGWPSDGADVEQLVAVADERLYAAKQGGRNRVVS
ncbi:MAG TPA: GGDEF domain-containing protein [Gemmatimonadaceae bacterium]|nr:GGDEF domain-containing protein [Gemmatimonadaceae bacterium]